MGMKMTPMVVEKSMSDMKIFSGYSNRKLAEDICGYLGVDLGKLTSFKFSDGNIYVRIEENVRGQDVFLIQSGSEPVNDNLMELLFLIDACKRASASSVTAVMPFYPYSKGDKKDEPRVSIRGRVVADLLEAVGVDRVLTMDLHAPQIQGFFRVPVDNLYALPVLHDHLRSKEVGNLVVVSPDMGGVKMARYLARRLGVPMAIGDKERSDHQEKAKMMNIVGEVKGKNVVVIDDIVFGGGTLTILAEALVEHGAGDIYACVTHGVLTGKASESIASSPICELAITDTVFLAEEKKSPKIKQLSVAALFGEAIKSIYQRASVSKLFEGW
jgi:ribose-phosphate pyrophosphokinase